MHDYRVKAEEIMLYDPKVLKTVAECRRAINRATKAGKLEFARSLLVRLAELGGEGYSDPLEASFHATLAVYEQTLKRGSASRTRIKLNQLGGGVSAVEKVLSDWCRKKPMHSGFRHLIENGLKDQVGEYIVGVKFPKRFPAEIVKAARNKLVLYDILSSDELDQITNCEHLEVSPSA